jgi:hypothetical protein
MAVKIQIPETNSTDKSSLAEEKLRLGQIAVISLVT